MTQKRAFRNLRPCMPERALGCWNDLVLDRCQIIRFGLTLLSLETSQAPGGKETVSSEMFFTKGYR